MTAKRILFPAFRFAIPNLNIVYGSLIEMTALKDLSAATDDAYVDVMNA